MKSMTKVLCVCALAVCAANVDAGELKSGLEAGKFIGAFDVVKCAGATEDGVKVGSQLCYRCRYGGRPMVMVFARTPGKPLAMLTKQLDKAVASGEQKGLRAFVNLLGDDRDELEVAAADLGKKNKVAKVPVVVPVEYENGPGNYGINPKADVTVILASGGKVTGNFSFAKGELKDAGIKAIVEAAGKLAK